MKLLKILLYLCLFLANSLYAIGDGPRLTEGAWNIILITIAVVFFGFIYLLFKSKIFRKFVFFVGILSLLALFINTQIPGYRQMSKYKDFFCENTKKYKDRVYIDNLVGFEEEYEKSSSRENVLSSLTEIDKRTIECINENIDKQGNTLNSAAAELLINKNYEKSKNIFFELAKNKNIEAANYYYLLTGDMCFTYYLTININKDLVKTCKLRPLIKNNIDDKFKTKHIDRTYRGISYRLKNFNPKQSYIGRYYELNKNDKELTFRVLAVLHSDEGISNHPCIIYSNKGELIHKGLTDENGDINFNHKKGTYYYVIDTYQSLYRFIPVIEIDD